MKPSLKTLSPTDELAHMRETLLIQEPLALLDRVVGHFRVLQTRAGLLLSLITLCLTITGFSGHRIASTGLLAALLLSVGLTLVVLAAGILFSGPLQLRWATRYRSDEGLDATLVAMLELRNVRTHRYHLAGGVLLLGLSGYMGALILSVLFGGAGA